MKPFLTFAILIATFPLLAQDNLLEVIDSETGDNSGYVTQTFMGTRLINGHSIETRNRGVLDVVISHRFGRLNSGAYEFFGLDESNVRIGAEYGLTDQFNIGLGRNSFEKTFDGFLKYKLLRQHPESMPVSVAAFASMAVKTLKTGDPAGEPDFSERLAYTGQLIIARKFSPAFSFQISPTLSHRNTVSAAQEANDIFALGAGGRLKLTKRFALNAEYFYQFDIADSSPAKNALAIGFDIETGGHVFQLHFTNARAMNEKGFITETTGDFFDGDVHFGFNISRTFQLTGR